MLTRRSWCDSRGSSRPSSHGHAWQKARQVHTEPRWPNQSTDGYEASHRRIEERSHRLEGRERAPTPLNMVVAGNGSTCYDERNGYVSQTVKGRDIQEESGMRRFLPLLQEVVTYRDQSVGREAQKEVGDVE